MTDFVKSLAIEFIAALIIAAVASVTSPYVSSLMDTRFSINELIIVMTLFGLIVSVIYTVQIHKKGVKQTKPINKTAKKFSCLVCGEPFEASPPDDVHTIGKREPQMEDSIMVKYHCVNRHENKIYWESGIVY